MASTAQVGINLIFSADTGQAKAQLQELRNTLTSLSTTTVNGNNFQPLTNEIRGALDATTKLSAALQTATNVDTGRLDLSKFSTSLKNSGLSLQQYAKQLTALGPQGEQAFLQLSRSITAGEVPLKKTNAMMGELWTTMKNTAKWQLSSSIIHGFMSAVQEAFTYAQDLNKSLNDISIVTEYSSDRMASFAREANKAAKALNTTTKAYTDASLIYFQQGLSDSEVKERTDITVKMANVTGESAKEVSDYMTAVWNNFYDGSKSLEYYADVMTKLGAATASSTDEIAAGLEKFSAIADTVGLSYEYATSALATVTAETRQSADVVGTAFKTLFARIEGLTLGETLDDGTDLNKYSQAMATVGVNIKDASGQLKDMDQILDELGARWQTLSKDQQVALAQAVGGIRQYNQMISLMDNWDVMQLNLDRTKESDGTLEAQAAIYAKSWQAAEDQVKASAETIYSNLINDEFFIDLTNGFAGLLDGIGKMTELMGGLPGVISLIGVAMFQAFGPQISESINNMWSNFLVGSGVAEQQANNLKQEMLSALDLWNQDITGSGSAGDLEVQYQKQQIELAHELQQISGNITEEEKERLKCYLQMLEAMQAQTVETKKQADEADNVLAVSQGEMMEATKGLGETEEQFEERKNQTRHEINETVTQNEGESGHDFRQRKKQIKDEAIGQMERNGSTTDEILAEGRSIEKFSAATSQSEVMGDGMDEVDFFSSLSDNGLDANAMQQTQAQLGNVFGPEVTGPIQNYIDLLNQVEQELEDIAQDAEQIDADLGTAESELEQAKKAVEDSKGVKGKKGKKAREAAEADLATKQQAYDEAKFKSDQAHYTENKSKMNDTSLSQEERDAAAAKVESTKKETTKRAAKGDAGKALKGSKKALTDYTKDTKKSSKAVETWSKKVVKNNKKASEAVEDFGKKSLEAGKLNGKAIGQMKNTEKIQEDYTDALKNASGGMHDFGRGMTNGLQGMSSFAMGLSSLKGGFDTLTNTDLSWFERITGGLMSVGMAFPALIDGVGRMKSGFSEAKQGILDTVSALTTSTAAAGASAIATNAEGEAIEDNTQKKSTNILLEKMKNGETLKGILTTAAATQGKKKEAAADAGSTVAKLAHAAAQWALNAATGPYGAILMIVVAVLMLAIAGFILAVVAISAFTKAMRANIEEDLKKEQQNQELIKSNRELTDSVQGLVEEYQTLKATGESTHDVMEKLKEQMPELIESYKELGRSLGIDLDVTALENAYKAALASGNWDDVEMHLARIETEIIAAEQLSYKTGATSASKLMALDGREGLGNDSDGGSKYNIHLGGSGADDQRATSIMKEVLEDKGLTSYVTSETVDENGKLTGNDKDSVDLTMDLSSPTAMVNYYESLLEVQAKLERNGDTSSAMYSEITKEINEMADAYAEARPQAEAFLNTLAEDIDSAEYSEYMNMFGVNKEDVDSLDEYNSKIDSMAETYAELNNITKAEALAAIEASEAFSKFANANSAIESMSYDLSISAENTTGKTAEDIKNELQAEYDNLPEGDKALFLTLDFAELDPNNLSQSIQDALAKAREDQIVAQVKVEAGELELDESAFESYADILMDTNEHLEDNKAMAYKVALQNARLSKGLVTLTDNFKDHVAVLAEGNRSSYEYAEAIGALKDGFEEMFGYKPSTVYIEGHLEEIQQLANGNLEVLQGLQDDLAEDYVLTMDVATAINDNGTGNAMSTDDVRETLIAGLEEIDTSIEVGEGTTISDDFLNSMQAMLDQGQITEEQMQEMFRMKGIEMKVTGYKNVPGPKTRTVQTITNGLGIKSKKIIEEQQDIQVPIINGDDSNIYGGSPGNITATNTDGEKVEPVKASELGDDKFVAEFAKSADANSIDTKAFEDASGEKETQKKIDALEEEKDLYHQINKEIEATERQLNKLERAEERAFGKQKLAQMQETIKGYEAAAKQQEEAAKMYEENSKKFGQKLIDEYGISLNSQTGVISNWSEVEARELSYREAAYRSGNEDAIAEADARWEAYQKDVANYEEALEEKNNAEEAAQEYRDQIYDKYLEGLEYQLEIKLMVDDRQLEYLDYMMSKIEDDAFATAERIALLGDKTETLMSKSQAYNQNINDLLGKHGLTADQAANMSDDELVAAGFTQDEVDSLNEWSAELLSINQELMETKKEVEESLMAEYDAWMEDMDEEIATIEHASSVLDHYSNIIDIAGKKHLGFTDEMMQDLSRAQLEVANNNLKASKAKYDAAVQSKATIEAELEAAKARLAKNPQNEQLQQDVKYWEESLQTVNTSVQEAQDAYLTQLETTLEQAKNAYIDMVDDVLNAFEEGVSKTGKSLEKLSVDLERTSEKDDRYLEDYQKMYELNKLSRDLETKLNKSSSLNEQKALRQQIEKINQLKAEDVEMSEHDLAVLQKQVEVEQARIAMQEAQNAKTQVIRRRDSEGNWGYVYTADQEAQADATQNYEDKMYELMNLNDTYLDDLSNSIIEAQTQMRAAIAELSEEDFASKEEYMAAVQEIQDYYSGLINYYYDEMNKTIGYNQEVYALDLEARLGWSAESLGISQQQLIAISEIRREDYASLDEYYAAIEERTGLDKETIKALEESGTLTRIAEVGKQKIANEDLQTSFADTRYAQVTEYTTMEEAQTDFTSATNTMVSELGAAYDTFEQDLEEAFSNAGEDMDTFKDTVEQDISGPDGVVDQSEKAAGAVEQMKDDMETAFQNAATAVSTWQSTYSEQIGLVIGANEKLYNDLGTLIDRLGEAEGQIISYANTAATYGGGSGTGGIAGDLNNILGDLNPDDASGNGGSGSKKGTWSSTQVGTVGGWNSYDNYTKIDPSKVVTYGDSGYRYVYANDYGGYVNVNAVHYSPYVGSNMSFDDAVSNGQYKNDMFDRWLIAKNTTVYHLTYTDPSGEKTEYFDTGGYTGAWGTEGRMAMLHQKELVLNAHDTENFLMATGILREIVAKIELNQLSSLLNLDAIMEGLSQNSVSNLQQNITIQAEFPDATNHNEIELAFENLLNRASQYANRKS